MSVQEITPQPARISSEIPCEECGYTLRGLEPGGKCPECGTLVLQSLENQFGKATTENVTWARIVLTGLVAWFALTPLQIGSVLNIRFNMTSLTPTALNFPGPKIWGTPMYSRLRESQNQAASGYVYVITSAMAAFLIGARRRPENTGKESIVSLRRLTRWFPIITSGTMLGAMSFNPYFMGMKESTNLAIVISAIEIPGTVLLYLYLSALAVQLKAKAEAKTLTLIAIAAGVLMGMAAFHVSVLDSSMLAGRTNAPLEVVIACYDGVAFAWSAIATLVVIRLIMAIAALAQLRSTQNRA